MAMDFGLPAAAFLLRNADPAPAVAVDLHLGHSERRTADKRVGVGAGWSCSCRPSWHPASPATDANDEAPPILMVVANTLEAMAIAARRVRSWLLLTQHLFSSAPSRLS